MTDQPTPGTDPAKPSPVVGNRYEIRRTLGHGGMSIVFLAYDRVLARPVALKTLHEVRVLDENAVRRFRREADLVAHFHHPALVPVHEIIEDAGKMYIAMEYVEGDSLDRHVRRYRPDLTEKIALLERIADGVAYAHQQGVVHRDLKPQNVLVTRAGAPKVIDFGLARLAEGETFLTTTGTTIGTPPYMAPEQIRGRSAEISARSDVYALGAILYELLTGVLPHPGSCAAEVFRHATEEEPIPPRVHDPSIPRDLEEICLKALDREPSRRYPSAREFSEDLRRYLHSEPVRGRRPGVGVRLLRFARRHRISAASIGVASLLLSGFAATSMLSRWRTQSEIRRLSEEGSRAMDREEWAAAAARFAEAQKLAPREDRLWILRSTCESMDRSVRALANRDAAGQGEAIRWEREAERSVTEALALAPNLAAGRRILADIAGSRMKAAFAERDFPAADGWARECLQYGGSAVEGRVRCSIVLRTRAPAATAYLFRYVERRSRWLPCPSNSAGDTTEPEILPADPFPPSDPEARRQGRGRTAYPLRTGSSNEVAFPIRVLPGSYLFLIRSPGYQDALYPVLAEPGGVVEETVRLVRPESVPDGFVYVPGGSTILGGDPQAFGYRSEPKPAATERISGFFISRFSLSAGQVLEMLNDRTFLTLEDARAMSREMRTAVRDSGNGFVLAPGQVDDMPAGGVTFAGAEVVARWWTRKSGGRWTFRVPTAAEWERAARGADGRRFPWGDRFDTSFCENWKSAGLPMASSVLGRFPADESPFGVRDMAGVVMNWTSSSETAIVEEMICKGGSWYYLEPYCRSAANFMNPRTITGPAVGVRLVAPLPDE